ncbi:DUF4374 domain-containing protein [Aquimarina sp. RZ0]|uniref:DUF4374 domain-containing protein n=1 Tax=Aquimarina sp. RZ0 TaxID=2607730 RepID=UPI0011F29E2D|nr:DUF4374 domain-containing protein [Aquimarina sp. RZ0]KAA1246374.1 DUF4374 domain-containing protein [Aquimarina sp. RZ0]
MKQIKITTLLAIVILLAITACSSDDETTGGGVVEPDVTGQSSKGFVMALRTTGDNETDYIVSKEDIMSGEISAEGTGIELTSWRFFYPVGKTLFSTGYSEDNQGAAYADNGQGSIEKKGGFIFDNALEMFGATNDKTTLLAMEINREDPTRRLHFMDAQNGLVTEIKNISIYQEIDNQDPVNSILSWPTALEVRGDNFFIPFHKVNTNTESVEPDEALVAIYPFPAVGSAPEKIITDNRTGPIGVNGATTGLIETANGDLYSFSCGAVMAGFKEASTKPSGILKIKSNETEFDSDYFFNIEEATNGGKLFSLDYAGGTKAIARILTSDTGEIWGAFTRKPEAFNQKLVIIDLEAKTVTDVANVPLHAKRYTSPILVEAGKAYVSIETATDAHVYQVDIETATSTKGAKIIGKTIKGFFRLQ